MSFDIGGPLPTGTVVLEASAGTGKTWTIAALATRYVAEGRVELSQLLLATFSRAATQELRERVRARMVSVAAGLARPGASAPLLEGPAAPAVDASASGTPTADGDPLLDHLRDCPPDEREQRRSRLLQALAQFDAATIATTHSFCSAVLDGLGIAGEADPGAQLVESVDDLLREVVDDLYLRKYARPDADPPSLAPELALQVARAAVADRTARLEPASAASGSPAGQRIGLGRAAVAELERRKRAAGVRDFDDLLILLRDVLADPQRGPAARARVADRYRVVLVDEFQDTDPVQWQVLRLAFHGVSTLVLIGDPKQAVYAFRGAEVRAYLDAVADADVRASLSVNQRSDAALLSALGHLLDGAALGDPRIVVRPVRAAIQHARLSGAAPMRLRVLARQHAGPLTSAGMPAVKNARAAVATDLATQVVVLLEGPARLHLPTADDPGRPVRPGDVAVLVRKATQGELVQEALGEAGVPCVVTGGASVYATDSARHWQWLLRALEQPHRAGALRLAALTPLVGRTATELDTDPGAVLDETGALVREAVARFDAAGPEGVLELLAARTGLEARLLSRPGGERRLTDVRHLAQLLHATAPRSGVASGLSALLTHLTERIDDPASGSAVERSRRLESDAAAVQVLTVHASKGLEFPVVLIPFGWDGARSGSPTTLRLHDDAGARVLDVGGESAPGWAAHKAAADREDDGEELRLLYVALTRAQCHLQLWWAPSRDTRHGPLHRLLLGRTEGSPEPAPAVPVPTDGALATRLDAWGWPQEISVEAVTPGPLQAWQPATEPTGSLAAAVLGRRVDDLWRRTSYTALTAAAHDSNRWEPSVGSEPEQPAQADEPRADEQQEGSPPFGAVPFGGLHGVPPDGSEQAAPGGWGPDRDLPSPFVALAGGAVFGTLVHAVLESVDATAGDLPAELLACCRGAVTARLSRVDPAELAAALQPVLETPLGPGLGALAGVAPADRLAELSFELPLSGGDRPTEVQARLDGLAELLARHLSPHDPLAAYPDRLAELGGRELRGYLTGSIDAVLRRPDGRHAVVDYKTNRLGEAVSTADYRPAAMAAEMMRSHYPLQALLYGVALHRFLRWRLPGYDPARHLGGAQYLFVRGMAGPATPSGCGVFTWDPGAGLVTDASDLLAGSS